MTRQYDRPAPRHDDDEEREPALRGDAPAAGGRSRSAAVRRARPETTHEYHIVHEATRFGSLCAWLDMEMKEGLLDLALVFAKNRYIAHDLAYSLNLNGFDCEVYEPAKFEESLRRLERERRPGLFVVSDFDVRRVPTEGVSHVLHFHLTNEPERYEARMERADGVKSVAFLTSAEHAALGKVEQRMRVRLVHGRYELDDQLGEYRFSRDPDADRPGGAERGGDRPRGDRPRGGDRPRSDRPRGGDRSRGDRPRGGDRDRSDRGPRGGDRDHGDDRPHRGDRDHEVARDATLEYDRDRPRRGGRGDRDGRRRDGGSDAERRLEGYLSMATEQDGRRFVYRYKFVDGAGEAPEQARD